MRPNKTYICFCLLAISAFMLGTGLHAHDSDHSGSVGHSECVVCQLSVLTCTFDACESVISEPPTASGELGFCDILPVSSLTRNISDPRGPPFFL
ncbi:hypothetical protein ACFL1X_11725 [Candidatus Hydrogenedentota bacterium]